MAAITYWQVDARNDALVANAFNAMVEQTAATIADRVTVFEYGLRGARGAVVALGLEHLNRERFRAYAATREIAREFHGAKGFGFIRFVPAGQLDGFLASARADDWPGFSLKALDAPARDHYVIQYIEPVAPNLAAVGLDIASERRRRIAAEHAVDVDRATITEPLTLVQEAGKESRAFLVLLPAYRAGVAIATRQQRWDALMGWSYAPVLIDDVLAGIPGENQQFYLRVSDLGSALGREVFYAGPSWDEHDGLVRSIEIPVFDRSWHLDIAAAPKFHAELGLFSPILASTFMGLGLFLVSAVFAFRRSLKVAGKAALRAEAENEAKTAFLANISHEIRTPMNAILGMLQLLHRTPLQTAQRDFVAKAESAAKLLLAVLNDVLDFSKVESGRMALDPVQFSPEALFQAVGSVVLGAGDRPEVEMLFDIDPGMPLELVGDDLRIKQVLTNLASNALKFTERGEVILSARRTAATERAVTIEFRVRDTGIGIAGDHLPNIFEGFTQAEASTTRRFGGTGLGLAISRRLVQLMGGKLQVASVLGVGSEFWFELELERVPAAEPKPGPRALEGLTVLVVDDNPTSLRIISEQCRHLGAKVQVATDAATALAVARSGDIDVALVDWQMPGVDGIELAGRLSALAPVQKAIALVLMTAATRQGRALEVAARHAHIAGLVFKPMSPGELKAAVLTALSLESLQTPDALPAAAGPGALADCRVLVVEDNRVNQQVAQELLEAEGAIVRLADDGLDALEQLRREPGWPQLILMDIQMPRCDGFECTLRLRDELGLSVPVVAMTANFSPADTRREREVGMVAHVSKPFAIEDLVSVILETLGPDWATEPAPANAVAGEEGEFDGEAALRRFGGKSASYCRALRSFATEGPVLATQVLGEADPMARARQLHTIKGLAATVGAMELARLAASAEEAVRAGDEAAAARSLRSLSARMIHARDWSLEEAARLSPLPVASTTQVFAPNGVRMDGASLLSALTPLRPLLASNRLEAVTAVEALCVRCGEVRPPLLDQLMASLEVFDFPAALVSFDRLVDQLASA